MKMLDLSAGKRAIWYNKNHPLCTYLDKREEVNPDIVIDTNDMGDKVGYGYNLIVWDPPHLNCGKNSDMSARYGHHTTKEILELLEKTSREAWRVSAKNALMAFKWNDHDISLDRVYKLMPDWEPLFGNVTKFSKRSDTRWIMFLRKDHMKGAEA